MPASTDGPRRSRLIAALAVLVVLLAGALIAVLVIDGDDGGGGEEQATTPEPGLPNEEGVVEELPPEDPDDEPTFLEAELLGAVETGTDRGDPQPQDVECPDVNVHEPFEPFGCAIYGGGQQGSLTVFPLGGNPPRANYQGSFAGNGEFGQGIIIGEQDPDEPRHDPTSGEDPPEENEPPADEPEQEDDSGQ